MSYIKVTDMGIQRGRLTNYFQVLYIVYLPLSFDMTNTVYCRKILKVDFLAAYDFSNSNRNNFNVSIWYNSTFKNDTGNGPIALLRLPRSVNLVYIYNIFAH